MLRLQLPARVNRKARRTTCDRANPCVNINIPFDIQPSVHPSIFIYRRSYSRPTDTGRYKEVRTLDTSMRVLPSINLWEQCRWHCVEVSETKKHVELQLLLSFSMPDGLVYSQEVQCHKKTKLQNSTRKEKRISWVSEQRDHKCSHSAYSYCFSRSSWSVLERDVGFRWPSREQVACARLAVQNSRSVVTERL